MARIVSIVAFVGFAFAAEAGTSSRSVNITGTYSSNWDDVKLVQEGDRVTGTYVCCGGGTINGRIIEGRVLRYSWHEPNGAGDGHGVWRIQGDGRLDGTWGHGPRADDGGPWTLVPKKPSARIAQ